VAATMMGSGMGSGVRVSPSPPASPASLPTSPKRWPVKKSRARSPVGRKPRAPSPPGSTLGGSGCYALGESGYRGAVQGALDGLPSDCGEWSAAEVADYLDRMDMAEEGALLRSRGLSYAVCELLTDKDWESEMQGLPPSRRWHLRRALAQAAEALAAARFPSQELALPMRSASKGSARGSRLLRSGAGPLVETLNDEMAAGRKKNAMGWAGAVMTGEILITTTGSGSPWIHLVLVAPAYWSALQGVTAYWRTCVTASMQGLATVGKDGDVLGF